MSHFKRIMGIMLSLVVVLTLQPVTSSANQSRFYNFRGGYTLTGEPASDMVSIATAQIGATKSELGYTEDWCDNFISDVAIIAGQADAVPQAGSVSDFLNALISAGAVYVSSPLPGDIVIFTSNYGYSHAGLVIDSSTSINGNFWSYGYSQVEKNSTAGILTFNSWGCVYIRPAYKRITSTYTFDVNAMLDGNRNNHGYDWMTFDVYLNGSLVADDVTDFSRDVNDGTSYSVTDIHISGCHAKTCADTLTGTVSGGTTEALLTAETSHSDLKWETVNEENYNYVCSSCGETVKSASLQRITELGKNTYYFFTGKLTWWEAREFSWYFSDDAHLMSVTSEEEQRLLDEAFDENGISELWLGGSDADEEGVWTWTTGEPFEYTNWREGEPSNSDSSEHYLGTYVDSHWNDFGNGSSIMKGFVLETDCKHVPEDFEAFEATCSEDGRTAGTKCSVCGKIISGGEVIPALGHDYQSSFVPATCAENAVFRFTCSRCGDSYDEAATPENTVGEWSEEKPDGDESRIETRLEYRYKNTETTVSDNASLDGWQQTGSEWVPTGSGSIDYVASWPSGFDTGSGIYQKYSAVPQASETSSTKRELSSPSTVGYIYWHWSYPLSGTHSEGNRLIGSYRNEFIDGCGSASIFEAFESGSSAEYVSGARAFKATGHSTYSYWWMGAGPNSGDQLPIQRVSYTDYKKQYSYTRETDWSDWQTEDPGSATTTETRTVYRLVMTESDLTATGHQWGTGVLTTPPAHGQDGILTYTCEVCGETRTEIIKSESEHVLEHRIEAATCAVPGREFDICSICGEVFNETVIPTTEHTIVYLDSMDSTCTKDGLTSGETCAVCGTVLVPQEIVPAKGHVAEHFEKAATCTEDGNECDVCTVCGMMLNGTVIPATGHTAPNKDGKCDRCGEQLVSAEESTSDESFEPTSGKTEESTSEMEDESVPGSFVDPPLMTSDETTTAISGEITTVPAEEPASAKADETTTATSDEPSEPDSTKHDEPTSGKTDESTSVKPDETTTAKPYEPPTRTRDDTTKAPDSTTNLPYPTSNPAGLRGDADLNGKVNAKDARLVLRASAKLETLTGEAFANADLDGDKKLKASEARLILRYSAKLEKAL